MNITYDILEDKQLDSSDIEYEKAKMISSNTHK